MYIKMISEVEIPENIGFEINGNTILISSEKGKIERTYPLRNIKIEKKENKVSISPTEKTAKNRAIVGTFSAHIINMIKGVQEGFVYKLKVCSGHFPMNVKVQGNEISVSNFLGSKKVKKIEIPAEVQVKVSEELIEVSSINVEKAGNFASKIETLTRLNKKDRRIFQDGIFLIEKKGNKIE